MGKQPTLDEYEQQITDADLDSTMEWMRDELPAVAANIDRAFEPLRQFAASVTQAMNDMRLPLPRITSTMGEQP